MCCSQLDVHAHLPCVVLCCVVFVCQVNSKCEAVISASGGDERAAPPRQDCCESALCAGMQ